MFGKAALRHTVLAVLVPILYLNAGSARALYRCGDDTMVGSHCCCPTSAPSQRPLQDSFAQGCCCEVEQPKLNAAPAQARLERTELPQPRLIAAVAPALPRAAMLSTVAAIQPARVGLGPPPGPSLLLVKRSFLI